MMFISLRFISDSLLFSGNRTYLPASNLKTWVQVQALLFIISVVIDKAFYLFKLLFHGQQNGNNNIFYMIHSV